jgi:hypothetical protein
VNVWAGDCRGGDDIPLAKFRKERSWPLCTEGRLRRAGTHPGKARCRRSSGFARARGLVDSGGNGVNPRVGNALQYTRPGREEESGEVVRNHGVGTRKELAASSRRRASTWATRGSSSGSGLPDEQDDGGAIFGQSQERKLGRPGRKANDMGDHVGKAFCTSTGVRAAGPGRVGKDGAKVRRVEHSSPIRMEAPRMLGPRRPRRWQPSSSKVREGSCEGQRAAPSSCVSPRVSGLRACIRARVETADAEQEGSNPRWNGRSESNGERLARGRALALGNGEPPETEVPSGSNDQSW